MAGLAKWVDYAYLLFGVWLLFVTTKAVKTINAFGTAKAFGIALVAIIASLVFSNIVAGETIIPAG